MHKNYCFYYQPECHKQALCSLCFLLIKLVQKQNALLDSLEVSYISLTNGTAKNSNASTPTDAPKVFDVKLDLLQDDKEFGRIKTGIDNTRKGIHSCAHLKVDKIYPVDIKSMSDAFEKDGRKLSNIMELYHGSRVSNLISILSKGMVIPKASSPHVTGRLYHDGLYFSNISSKSLNYSYGYWSGNNHDNNCFMFLADVAMGQYYIPTGPRNCLQQAGYDSYYAQPNKSGIINPEMIVFRTSQANIKYLVEFKG